MSESLRASIIINNYNYGRFVGEAIESALRQTYRNTEVIVVDDGSTDNSQDVIRSFGERVIPIFKANGGQGSAFNAGFRAMAGDLACFLDADDLLLPTAMERSVIALQDLANVKVEWTLDVIDESGHRKGHAIPEQPFPSQDLYEHTIQNGPFYDWLITPPSSGNCYRRRFLEQVLPMPERPYRHGADVFLMMLAPIYGRLHRLIGSHGCYRQHGQNNYYGGTITEARLRDFRQRFEDCCVELERHLLAQGVEANTEQWRARNYNYLWPHRLLQARNDLANILPTEAHYVLINNGEWDGAALLECRNSIPFPQKHGEYWGPPVDEESAITELEGLQSAGVEYVVLWWTANWWLEVYPDIKNWLERESRCVLENERLMVFHLESV